MRTKVRLDYKQRQVMEEAYTSLMNFCPFFAYYFYDQMEDYPTPDVKTAATDGKRIFYNPDYFATLKPMERCFALAHEVYHVIDKHPTRMRYYHREGNLRGLPFYQDLFNICADYVINADLIASAIGTCNPAWLHDPAIKGNELVEDIYVQKFKQLPPPPPQPQGKPVVGEGGGQGQTTGSDGDEPPPSGGTPTPSTYGQTTGRKAGHDPVAQGQGGRFDEVLEPHRDAATGKEDLPSDMEFREAVSRAEVAAKRAGKMPANLQRIVREIVDPQIYWKDELRLRVAGKVGARRETWERPNRRRIVLNPLVYMPGKQGHGAELITVVIDNSGSINDKMLTVFFSEAAAIMNECRPKRVQVIWCDAKVQRVEEARSLDELLHIRVAPGGGGTSFRPPFAYLADERITPDTLVYLTDMYPNDGWPDEPDYPVIWCATTDIKGPYGETVRVHV
jgi:predicted metal-dependent peptidase